MVEEQKGNNSLILDFEEHNLFHNEDSILNDMDNFKEHIFNLELPNDLRIRIINKFYPNNENNFIEIISAILGMYSFSGTKILQNFIYTIITDSIVSNFLKVELAKCLLSFQELEEEINENDDDFLKEVKILSNEQVRKKNEDRTNVAYKSINYVCSISIMDETLPTLLKVSTISLLMTSDEYKTEALSYFFTIINNPNLDCSYRYKTVLSLERNDNILNKDFYIYKSCLEFSRKTFNDIMHRLLACQNILQNYSSFDENLIEIQELLLAFANDENIEYNLRADAADVLLNLGNEDMKIKGREIIYELGKISGPTKTIFDNAQNVHVKEIEKSVLDIITKLSSYPTMKLNDEYISLNFVQEKVSELLKNKSELCNNSLCFNNVDCIGRDENYFCSEKCKADFENKMKIVISFNRISMDKALYFNNTISNILVKVWSYIENHEEKDEMKKRLLEELMEMSGTCSSGFASRMVNTVTGFGEFHISISWEDQIVSNFYGRLSACARKISNADSPYYGKFFDDIFKLYLNKIKFLLPYEKLPHEKKKLVETHDTHNYLTYEFRKNKYLLGKNSDDVKRECVEEFAGDVLNEMTEKSSNYHKRMNFSYFFKTHMPEIHQEMFSEFKDLITESEFDLAFRRAISIFDGEK